MQCSHFRLKHVVCMMVVLGFCQQVTVEFTSARVPKTTVNSSDDMITCDNCNFVAQEVKPVEEKCSNARGWNLKGSDWGCCGNYAGCCTYASYVCYIHDAVCRCCDIGGKFCGPLCKPEPSCWSSADLSVQNDVEVHKRVNSNESKEEESLNVDNFDLEENYTDVGNTSSMNYFVRGSATSGIGGLLFQDGDNNEDGSGDID